MRGFSLPAYEGRGVMQQNKLNFSAESHFQNGGQKRS